MYEDQLSALTSSPALPGSKAHSPGAVMPLPPRAGSFPPHAVVSFTELESHPATLCDLLSHLMISHLLFNSFKLSIKKIPSALKLHLIILFQDEYILTITHKRLLQFS